MKKVLTFLGKIASFFLHLAAGGIILYFWLPIARWYYGQKPAFGVDLYNSISYVADLARDFSLRVNGWKYIWFAGIPRSADYPTLYFYLILPLTKFFSIPRAVQLFALGSVFLFLFFSYLLFYRLSKSRALALTLALGVGYSIAVYRTLIWAGSIPSFVSQMFFPLILFCLVSYLEKKDKKWLYLAGFLTGIGFLGHGQPLFAYTLPIALIVLFFSLRDSRFAFKQKIGEIAIFLGIAYLVGYPIFYTILGPTPLHQIQSLLRISLGMLFLPFEALNIIVLRFPFKSTFFVHAQETAEMMDIQARIALYNRQQFYHIFADTNRALLLLPFIAGIFFIISLIFRKRKERIISSVAYFSSVAFVILYIFVYSRGISFLQGGWYRVFWPVPVVLGMLVAYFWGSFFSSFLSFLRAKGGRILAGLTLVLFELMILSVSGFLVWQHSQGFFEKTEQTRLREYSSAFPDRLNYYLDQQDWQEMKNLVAPSWLPVNSLDYRLYSSDQRVNIWWNSLFAMPLVRGYIDPPFGTGDIFLLGASLTQVSKLVGDKSEMVVDQLVANWGYDPEAAHNTALFLLDWYAAKYLEVGHPNSSSFNPLSSYFTDDHFQNFEKVTIPGRMIQFETESGEPEWKDDGVLQLHFYELKNEFVSPIVQATNAPLFCIIGNNSDFEAANRVLASNNINSQILVPLHLERRIDKVSFEEMKMCDALFLYGYDYKNQQKAWSLIDRYAKEGGKVFIETGSHVKETATVDPSLGLLQELPVVFPIEKTKKESFGHSWGLKAEKEKYFQDVSLENFGSPTLPTEEGIEEWEFSLPEGNLREGARVVLSASGIPLVVEKKYGEGKVIWSGMNLPYHANTQKSHAENIFFKNLINELIPLEVHSSPEAKIDRVKPEKMIVEGEEAKGILFKERAYSGWKASAQGGVLEKKLKIYKAGMAHPGFIYVHLPENLRDDFKVIFSFRGSFWSYFHTIISLVISLIVLERVFLNGKIYGDRLSLLWSKISRRVGSWWEKEEEY